MVIKIIFFIFIYNIVSLLSADLDFPDRLNKEWILEIPNRVYTSDELYVPIDGGAEIFLEFGFENLTVCKYTNNTYTIELEVYKMENTQAARGIYLLKTSNELPIKEISARNTAGPYQIIFTAGQFFIQINNFSGNKQLFSLMIHLSQNLADQIEEPPTTDLFTFLPKENIIEGSQVIFRGPLGLQAIYSFGKGDILLLGGKIFGVSADYTTDSTENFSRIVIPYANNNAVQQSYKNLILNIDPDLEIIDRSENYFVFKDYKEEYGLVKIDDNLLKIQLHLSSKPSSSIFRQ